MQVAGVAVFCVVFNTPRFFQFRIDVEQTSLNTTSLHLLATAIGEQSLFGKIYTNALYTLIVLLLPLLLLLGLNTRLMLTLGSARRRRDKFVHGRCAAPDEANISLVMVIIIVAFIVFHTPDRLLQIAKEFSLPDQFRCGRPLYFVSGVCTLLIVLNSSTNFLIYYTWRRRFRKIFMLTFCRPQSPRYRRNQTTQTAYQLALLPYTHPTVPSSHTSSHASSSHSSNHAPGNASSHNTRDNSGSNASGQSHGLNHCCGLAQTSHTSLHDSHKASRSLR
ncbi:hypothetical protein LSAT2_006179 [Lamellibrachia satsuma]|nr:hypothetical protein LSAT2_006179 [Lamellibrachia satsuma]